MIAAPVKQRGHFAMAGALVQWAAAPTRLVYIVLAVAFVIGMAAIALGPETESRRSGAFASLAPRMRIAKDVRPQFLAQMPAWFATWAQLGLTLRQLASLARRPSCGAPVAGL